VYTDTIANAYNAATANSGKGLTFAALPAQAQTAIVDIGFVQGTKGLEGTQFWAQMTTGQFSAAQANLNNYGTNSSSLNSRAQSDGNYMSQAPASSYPTPTPKK
jgi:hypothetical protein